MHNLKGLSLSTNDNSFDFSNLSPSLPFLQTEYEYQNTSWLYSSSISELSPIRCETENLRWLSEMKNRDKLRTFEIYASYGKRFERAVKS